MQSEPIKMIHHPEVEKQRLIALKQKYRQLLDEYIELKKECIQLKHERVLIRYNLWPIKPEFAQPYRSLTREPIKQPIEHTLSESLPDLGDVNNVENLLAIV